MTGGGVLQGLMSKEVSPIFASKRKRPNLNGVAEKAMDEKMLVSLGARDSTSLLSSDYKI